MSETKKQTAKPKAAVETKKIETKKTEVKKADTKTDAYNPWEILMHPHLAEKSMSMVETKNILTFIVNPFCTKEQIAEAVEKGFQVEVSKVNVEITQRGQKKAYVRLAKKYSAADIATRLGMI